MDFQKSIDGFYLWRNYPISGFDSKIRRLTGIIRVIISMYEHLPDDPELLKKMLLVAFNALVRQQEVGQFYETHIIDLK